MRKITWLAAALAMLITVMLSGCGRAADTGAAGGGGGDGAKGTVGIAMPTKSSERWVADGKNMVDQFKARLQQLAGDATYGAG